MNLGNTYSIPLYIFFHPDCTVGIGIAPIQRVCARGLYGQPMPTAGREFHPALKIYMKLVTAYHRTQPLSIQATYGRINQAGVDGVVLGDVAWGILKLRMLPLAEVSVTSPPMTWFL